MATGVGYGNQNFKQHFRQGGTLNPATVVPSLSAISPQVSGLRRDHQGGFPNGEPQRRQGTCVSGHSRIPEYTDTATLPAPGAGAVWKYKAIYLQAEQRVGQWSDVVSIPVAG